MTPEKQTIDLNTLSKNRPFEIKYCFDEGDEYEPTMNLIPLTTAVDLGLATAVKAEDKMLYVVTPAVINTTQGGEMAVDVVSADWNERLLEKEVATYTFTNCISCGGSLMATSTEEITEAQMRCGYCGSLNKGDTSPKTKKIQIRELTVEHTYEEESWVGTVDELKMEAEAYHANQSSGWGRFKNHFNSEPAPIAAIQAGGDLVQPSQKIIIAGPFSDAQQKDVFVQIGKLSPVGEKREEKEQQNEVMNQKKWYPQIPSSYLFEDITDITDRKDYLIIIESDSGEKLPLVIMTDQDGNPSRLAVPVSDLLDDGWKISLIGFNTSLNSIIDNNNLQELGGLTSVNADHFGTVKVFHWKKTSERHEAITDELENNDFQCWDLWVNADIPNGDVSSLSIKQS